LITYKKDFENLSKVMKNMISHALIETKAKELSEENGKLNQNLEETWKLLFHNNGTTIMNKIFEDVKKGEKRIMDNQAQCSVTSNNWM
jgi:hypothetical protein